VSVTADIKKLRQYPTCGRHFERHGQSHSCSPYTIELHFEGKPAGKKLYEQLKRAIKKDIGSFQVESQAYCIHLVNPTTFAAIKIFKDKLQVDFSLSRMLHSKRIERFSKMSANSYLYMAELTDPDDINTQLLDWIGEAYNKNQQKATSS